MPTSVPLISPSERQAILDALAFYKGHCSPDKITLVNSAVLAVGRLLDRAGDAGARSASPLDWGAVKRYLDEAAGVAEIQYGDDLDDLERDGETPRTLAWAAARSETLAVVKVLRNAISEGLRP